MILFRIKIFMVSDKNFKFRTNSNLLILIFLQPDCISNLDFI